MQTADSIDGNTGHPTFRRDALSFLAILVAYAALSFVGLKWALIDGAGSPVWPAAGVGLAGLLLGGVRLWPAIAIARLAAAFLAGSQQPLWADALIALGNALATAAGALMLVRLGKRDFALRSLGGVLRFCFVGSAVTAGLSALVGCAVLSLSSGLSAAAARAVIVNWSVGAFVGAITLGPMILAWADRSEVSTPARKAGFLALMLLTAIGAHAIFTSIENEDLRTWQIFPLLIAAGLVFGVRGASTALVIISAIAVWGTSEGQGPFILLSANPQTRIFLLQQFLGTAALTTLILSVVSEERRARDLLAARQELLRLAEERSRARAEELQVILDAVPAMILIAHDPECREMSRNQFGTDLLRRLDWQGDIAGLNPAAPMFDAQGRDLREEDRPMRRAGRGETISDFEGRIVLGESHSLHFIGGARPLFTAEGKVRGAVGAFIDVTARKRAEDRASLLAMEVDHRAKNIMALVQSVVRQSHAEDVGAFRKAVTDRINNLARVHGLLAANRWDGADIAEIVRSEMRAFGPAGEEDHLLVSGPDVRLRPGMAQGLSMVIHELATNAVKHGAFSVPQGRVRLTWRIETPEGARVLCFDWVEENGPPVVAPERTSFGHRAITGIIEHQLGGTIRRDWRPGGLAVAFRVPLEA